MSRSVVDERESYRRDQWYRFDGTTFVEVEPSGAGLLCGPSGAPSDALELCERLNTILGCRCYYSMPIDDITQLPRVLGKLDELLRLRCTCKPKREV